jgi:L-ascorbate metabolism protein UlaG (beta-lactamase superfamily)
MRVCVCVCVSNSDHFDDKVEASLRRDMPIISTLHAYRHLSTKPNGEEFTHVLPLDPFENCLLPIVTPGNSNKRPCIKVTAMPGKHVPPGPRHILEKLNELVQAVPPTNGWMVELGHEKMMGEVECGYRIYISGDTLMVDELKAIPERYKGKQIDLMLIHLGMPWPLRVSQSELTSYVGGTTLPGPHMPLLMVTMDDKQGVQLIRLINPKLTIPIHFE